MHPYLSSSVFGLVTDSNRRSVILQAQEAQEDLIKTREELHMVMTAPPPPPPPPAYDHYVNDMEDGEESTSTYSAELQSEGFNDHRYEEQRITEAAKNERVQKQLMVRGKHFYVLPNLTTRSTWNITHDSQSDFRVESSSF